MLSATVTEEETAEAVGLKARGSKRAIPCKDLKHSREEIVEALLPLVRRTAERVHRRLPPGVDLESLMQAGVMGLLEAVDRYKPERGLFQTYARYRIQGEIMEYLRSLDWVSRSVRAWGRKVVAARTRLTARLGREASSEEMAAELGLSLSRYYRVDRKLNEAMLLSLENLSLVSEEDWQKAQEEAFQNPFQDPLTLLENKNLLEKMTAAIEELPERERLVLTLYYYEELTLQEIGEILELTEGRISQIHTQAVARLRIAISGQPKETPQVRNLPTTRFPAPTTVFKLVRYSSNLPVV